ncbi:11484_t:CDS:2, partial [Dentiscutata heterogama]
MLVDSQTYMASLVFLDIGYNACKIVYSYILSNEKNLSHDEMSETSESSKGKRTIH